MAKDARGHGSNPRGYRGNHPDKIKTVHGAGVGIAHAVTHSGNRYRIRAADGVDQYMHLRSGKSIKDYPKAEPVPANNAQAASQLASGPKSAPAPIHEAMRTEAFREKDPAKLSEKLEKAYHAEHGWSGDVGKHKGG